VASTTEAFGGNTPVAVAEPPLIREKPFHWKDAVLNGLGTQDLSEELKNATVDDIEFVEQAVAVHPQESITKVGFIAKSVRGVAVPRPVPMVYVRGKIATETYWSLVDWTSVDSLGIPKSRLVASELEAKAAILAKFKELWS
jgi:hypothetical protein